MADVSNLHCSFCGTSAKEVSKLIAGPEVYICNECVRKCYGILKDNSNVKGDTTQKIEKKKPPSPRDIKVFLDEYVIGQDHAKEVLSVAVYNHYKRVENPVVDGVEIEKSNILMCGPTGVGKTLLAQTVARMLNVPFAMVDATSLTEAGYVGEDVETIIARLLSVANNDVKAAERGIVFVDEIDKKKVGGGGTHSRDVSGEGVQQALLKLFEGSEVMVAPIGVKKTANTEMVKVNTKNILFILSGAFVGLDKIVSKTLTKDENNIGFSAKTSVVKKLNTVEILSKAEPDHFVQFGMIPELIGRLPIVAPLGDLDEKQLVRVLTEPKNAILKQLAALFRLDGVQLDFEPEALLAIAKLAKQRKTNGRALRSVLENRLLKTQFRLPDLYANGVTKIVVRENVISDNGEPDCIVEPHAELQPAS